ncbi:MAG: ankyrin repeat domain-containing protein [Planctomycetaceae bacterium]|nr:ankyrin repeat domain-containing protein [Planctomycetaceae bacterium]
MKKIVEGKNAFEEGLNLSNSELNKRIPLRAHSLTEQAFLFDNGDEWTALTAALATRNDLLGALLIGKGADVNVSTKMGYTPLWIVASREKEATDNIEIARLLLAAGADTEAFPRTVIDEPIGRTALHVAVSKLNTELVRLLVVHGADVHARDSNGNTVQDKLDMFIEQDEQKAVDEILDILDGTVEPPVEKTSGQSDAP